MSSCHAYSWEPSVCAIERAKQWADGVEYRAFLSPRMKAAAGRALCLTIVCASSMFFFLISTPSNSSATRCPRSKSSKPKVHDVWSFK